MADNDSKRSREALLEQARRLQEGLAAAQKTARTSYKNSAAGKTHQNIKDMAEAFSKASQTMSWLRENVASPVYHLVEPYAGWAWTSYKKLWHKVTMVPDADGDEQFSKKRAGIMTLATLGTVIALPGLIAGTGEFLWDATLMATTHERGTFYLSNAQEIKPDDNIWSVSGCENLPCTDQNSIYFRIDPKLVNHAWSLVENRNIFFPDNVAAAIPPGLNRCEIFSYGFRAKFWVRNFDIYPQLVQVKTCSPVQGDVPPHP